jgi:hypothetical protein
MRQLARRVQRVDVDDNAAGAQYRRYRDRVVQQVGQHDRDAVAALEALRLEPGGERARARVDVAEGDALLAEDIGVAAAVAGEALFEQRDQRPIAVDVDLRRYAGRVVLQPRTRGHHVLRIARLWG